MQTSPKNSAGSDQIDARDIMRGFPPLPEHQVSLANWMRPPYNRWAFQHLSQLVPVAPIRSGRGATEAMGRDIHDLDAVEFETIAGRASTVGQYLLDSYSDGFIVMLGGHVVCERYYNGMGPDSRHIIFSVSKSLTGSLTGILADRGQLDPDAPIIRYVPEVAGSAYGDATVRHLLDMTVGIRFVEDYTDTQGDFARYRRATGWHPVVGHPGPAFSARFSAHPSQGGRARRHVPLYLPQQRFARLGARTGQRHVLQRTFGP